MAGIGESFFLGSGRLTEPSRGLRVRTERFLRGEFRMDDLTALFLYARDRCDGRELVREIGDFVAHHAEREKGIITRTTRDWFAIAGFMMPRFGPGGPYPVDAQRLPSNAPLFVEAAMRRMDHRTLKRETGLSRSAAERLLPDLLGHLVRNSDNTYRLDGVTPREWALFVCLASHMIVQAAFTGERLFDDFSATLRSHGLLRKEEMRRFAELKTVIALYAISQMHNCRIVVSESMTTRLSFAPKDVGVLQVMTAAPVWHDRFANHVFLACAIFTMETPPSVCCTERLLNAELDDHDLEVGPDMKLDILS